MPMALAQVVRHGNITIMARNFGATRNRIGLIAIVSSASISLLTFMVPISAAKAEPERPITTMAVIKFPRHGNGDRRGDGTDRAKAAKFVGRLKCQDQANEEGN